MRILYSCPLDMAAHPAAASHVIGVAQQLVRLGHSVTLLHSGSPVPGLEKVTQITVQQSGSGWTQKVGCDIAFTRAMFREWRTVSYDLLYHRFQKASLLMALVARVMGIRIVLEVNTDLRSESDVWNRGLFRRLGVQLSERINYRSAGHLVVVTQGIKDAIHQHYGIATARISVIENGTDLETYRPLDRVECCHALGLDPSLRYGVFAGTHQSWQGLDTIIRSAIHLREAHPELVFLILGDGPERKRIETLIHSLALSTSFKLVGWCTPELTALHFGAADICLATYSSDAAASSICGNTYGAMMKGSPLKIFAYLAAGRPVVASDFAEAGVFVEKIGAGLSVPPESPELLAAAIGYILEHPQEAGQMGSNGRREAEMHHSWLAVARQIAGLFSQLVVGGEMGSVDVRESRYRAQD